MTDFTSILKEHAAEDVALLRAESVLAITHTKVGVLWMSVEHGVLIARDKMGEVLYQTAEDSLMIEYISNQYVTA